MNANHLIKLFTLANDFKEGDIPIGGTRDDKLRTEARAEIASIRIGEINDSDFVQDRLTEALHRSLDSKIASRISSLTIGHLKQILLGPTAASWIEANRDGLSSEAIAATAKLMSVGELSKVSRGLFNPLPGEGVTIGSSRHFGSRIQPNSPGDDETEILFSILEGLSYGCGDVIIGLNPASDDVDTIVRLEELLRSVVVRLELPTRYSVLSDIVKQTSAAERTKVDVGFQSLAGTSKALGGMVGLDVDGLLELARSFGGLYFETGQGSAVTNQADEGVDMVTLESRAYGLARYLGKQTGSWMIVNDVAGFIGPEVFRTGDQLVRACLEDTMMAKLHGLTMGLDVCATFHMGIAPRELERLTAKIVDLAAPAYLMGVAGNADPMLGYLTTSFREHPRLRKRTGRDIATVMKKRLSTLGISSESDEADGKTVGSVYAMFQRAGGDTRGIDALQVEAEKKLTGLKERGFELGTENDSQAKTRITSRIETIYSNARRALFSRIDDSVLRDVLPRYLRVRTNAMDRDAFLANPSIGERVCESDAEKIMALYPESRPSVQIIISDGLNANAVNESLRFVLPPLRKLLVQNGLNPGDTDIVVDQGRVRAGYHVGSLLDINVIVHFIGERPGTGINTLSAYLTYGRDEFGRSRWNPAMDHSWTNAVCGIHRRGRQPEAAVEDILRTLLRIFDQKCSGVKLR